MKPWTSALAACAAVASGAGWGWTRPDPPSTLAFLAVGQGDCVVLQHAGVTLLVDAAPATDRFDAGRRLAAPALHARGVETLDLVVITHPDADHVGGLPALARRFPIGRVAASSHFRDNESMLAALKAANIGSDRVLWIDRPLRATFGGLTATIAAPPNDPGDETNQGSLFVHLTNGSASATLSGDAGVDTEASVAALGMDWGAAVVMAGHHGSQSSSADAWIDAVGPTYAVASCGRDNRYGHPHPSVLDRYARHGVRVLRTDVEGTIEFAFGQQGVRLLQPAR